MMFQEQRTRLKNEALIGIHNRSPTLSQYYVSGLLRPSHPSLIQKLKIKLMQLVQEKGAVRLRIFGLNDFVDGDLVHNPTWQTGDSH